MVLTFNSKPLAAEFARTEVNVVAAEAMAVLPVTVVGDRKLGAAIS
jgi:hypothetical protein